jgi:predicted NUDIX family phosphoesterase
MKDEKWAQERVLVIPTQVLRDAGMFQGLTRDVRHYQPLLLDVAQCSFLPRALAEDDPSHKQLIPYVVMKYRDQVFHYTRGQGGNENRLRSLRSVGVGGHINPADHEAGMHPYRQGMLREVAEEVEIETTYEEKCLGFINDDSVPVGRVHLGIVHVFELAEPRVRRREADLTQDGFAPIGELWLGKESFETWSQFVLEELAGTEFV